MKKEGLRDIVFENPIKDADGESHVGSQTDDDGGESGNMPPSRSSARKFKSFVKDSFVESIIFGGLDVEEERAMEKEIWEAGFGTDNDYSAFCYLLHPDTQPRAVYDVIQLGAALYTTLVVPWRLAFNEVPTLWSSWFMLDVFIDCLFMFDLILNFFAYERRLNTGQLITNRKVLAKGYLTSWFPIDFMATIPIDYIFLAIGLNEDSEEFRNLRALRLLRIGQKAARFVRLLRGKQTRDSRKDTNGNNGGNHHGLSKKTMFIYKIGQLCCVIVVTAHIAGCVWLHEGLVTRGYGHHGSWVDSRDWYLDCPVAECADMEAECLDVPTGCIELDWDRVSKTEMYVTAFYWVIVTLSSTGYGEIHPHSTAEQILCSLIIIMGTFIWAAIIAVFSETLNAMSFNKRQFSNKLRRVNGMLAFLGADKGLRNDVDRFYKYQYVKKHAFEQSMFDELPPKLRRSMVQLRFRDSLHKVPFLRGCSDETMVELCTKMRSFNVVPNEVIVHQGDTDRDLFIIEHGAAEVTVAGVAEPVEYLRDGSFFGEMSFFGLAVKRGGSVTATAYSELSWIDFACLTNVLSTDTALRKRMFDYASLRFKMYQNSDADLEDLRAGADELDGLKTLDEAKNLSYAKKIEDLYHSIQEDQETVDGVEIVAGVAHTEAEQTHKQLTAMRHQMTSMAAMLQTLVDAKS